MPETIGSVQVDIIGDYSSLQGDIDSATQLAAAGGEKIAEALTSGAAAGDALSASLASAAEGAQSFEEKIAALVDTGSSLAEALALVGTEAATIADATETAASEVEVLGGAAQDTAASAGQARDELGRFASSAEDAGEKSGEGADKVLEFAKSLLEIAGITVSIEALKEFVTEAIEVYAATEKATIALGFLTGDSEQAAQTIEHLKDVAMELALPFDSLIEATQKMTAFGFSADQTAEALTSAADAAAATGGSFDQAAGAIERMALGGMAGARQLVSLGLSAQDLADVMGVAVEDVQKDFKALDESLRVDVLTEALQKYQGAAETVADSTSGALQRMKTAWHLALDDVGAAIAPVVIAAAHFATDLAYYFQLGIAQISANVKSFIDVMKAAGDAMKFDFTGAQAEWNKAMSVLKDAEVHEYLLVTAHDAAKNAINENTDATDKNIKSRVAASLADKQGGEAVGNLVQAYRDFNVQTLQYVSAEQAAEDAAFALTVTIGQQGLNLSNAQRVLRDVLGDYADGVATWHDVEKALNAVNTAQKAVNETFAAMPALSLQPLIEQTQQAEKAFDALLPPIQALPPYIQNATDILKQMGIQVDSTGQATTRLVGLYERLGATTTTLDEQDAAWAKISGAVNQLAKTDLPLALSLYDQQLQKLEALGAPEGQLLALEAQRLTAEINIDAQTGKSATNQVIGLNNIRLAQQALTDQSQLWGQTVVGIENDIIKGFENMGSSIAKVIVEGGSMGDAFKKIGEQIAETILTTIINNGMKMLIDSIVKDAIPAVGSLGKAFDGLGQSISKMLGTAGSAASGAAGTATGAVQGINSAASGLVGLVGAIGAVVGAIAGIIGDIQQAHTNTLLDRIEHNTRYLQIEAEQFFQQDSWAQQKGVVETLDMIFDRMGDMWNTLVSIATELQNAAVAGSGLTPIPGGIGGGTTTPALAGIGVAAQMNAPTGLSGTASIGTLPSAVQLPSIPASPVVSSPSAGAYSASAGTVLHSIGSITMNIVSPSPRDAARQTADYLKTISPGFNSFNQ